MSSVDARFQAKIANLPEEQQREAKLQYAIFNARNTIDKLSEDEKKEKFDYSYYHTGYKYSRYAYSGFFALAGFSIGRFINPKCQFTKLLAGIGGFTLGLVSTSSHVDHYDKMFYVRNSDKIREYVTEKFEAENEGGAEGGDGDDE
mmetsp:Transcript_35643/g.49745  ORF Transcript_35643/g.49745 Transcript_35643/m.49745 type:complete len:146 (-) Transcript_35643:75-512(-)